MNRFRPLVVDPTGETPTQQLQVGKELDIPLEQRFQELQNNFQTLVQHLIQLGIELPEELTY